MRPHFKLVRHDLHNDDGKQVGVLLEYAAATMLIDIRVHPDTILYTLNKFWWSFDAGKLADEAAKPSPKRTRKARQIGGAA